MKRKLIYLVIIVLILGIVHLGYKKFLSTDVVNNVSDIGDATFRPGKRPLQDFKNGLMKRSRDTKSSHNSADRYGVSSKSNIVGVGTGATASHSSDIDSPFYKRAVEGVKLLGEGKQEEGLAILYEVLQKDPKNQVALEGLGLYYLEGGKNLEKAQEYLQKLVEINPANAVFLNEMTYVLEEAGGLDKVENYLKELSSRFPGLVSISTSLAHTITRQGRADEAIPYLEAAVSTSLGSNDRSGALYVIEDLANLYTETGNFGAAVKSFKRILSIRQQMLQESSKAGASSSELNDLRDEIVAARLEIVYTHLLENNCDDAKKGMQDLAFNSDDPGVQQLQEETNKLCH
ncbi:MAG: tetratricopeptide repeat protein [Oligoflexia bacterium]|nr:tetratricopeptide repeat protein [Oligoflexia bacterium]